MTDKKRKSPKKEEDKPATASPVKNAEPAYILASVTEPIPAHIIEHPVLPAAKTSAKKKPKAKTVPATSETPMDTSTNPKRRRNSGEGASKKVCSGPSHHKDPLEGPSNAFPQSQPLPQRAPLQPPLPSPPPPLPPPPPPQYRTPQHAPPKQQPSGVMVPSASLGCGLGTASNSNEIGWK